MKGEGPRATGEELGARLVDNGAGTVNVGNGILVSGTIETRRNLRESHLVLVTHTTKGGESIVDKSHMVENEGGRRELALFEGAGNEGETVRGVNRVWADVAQRRGEGRRV